MGKHARLHVVDAEPKAEKSPFERRVDDTVVTASSVTRDMIYGATAAAFGVSVMALAGAAFAFAPDAPSIGASPWLSGSQNAIKVAAFCLAVAAFAVPFHIAIWLPAKVRIWNARIQNRLARWSIEALEIGVIAFALVCAVGLPVSGLLSQPIPHMPRGIEKAIADRAASIPRAETKAAPVASVASQPTVQHQHRSRKR